MYFSRPAYPLSEKSITTDTSKMKGNEAICTICLDPIERIFGRLGECKHRFHYHCLNKWIKKAKFTCPVCRIEAKVVYYIETLENISSNVAPDMKDIEDYLFYKAVINADESEIVVRRHYSRRARNADAPFVEYQYLKLWKAAGNWMNRCKSQQNRISSALNSVAKEYIGIAEVHSANFLGIRSTVFLLDKRELVERSPAARKHISSNSFTMQILKVYAEDVPDSANALKPEITNGRATYWVPIPELSVFEVNQTVSYNILPGFANTTPHPSSFCCNKIIKIQFRNLRQSGHELHEIHLRSSSLVSLTHIDASLLAQLARMANYHLGTLKPWTQQDHQLLFSEVLSGNPIAYKLPRKGGKNKFSDDEDDDTDDSNYHQGTRVEERLNGNQEENGQGSTYCGAIKNFVTKQVSKVRDILRSLRKCVRNGIF